jgi:membrane protein DedA with SNARE-associated domain
VFNQFTHLVADASGWAYLIVFVLAFLDALVPVVPSETSVITAGVVAATGDLDLELIILGAALGAFLGDNAAYLIGHRYGERAVRRFFRGERSQIRLAWADRQLLERGGQLIATARFIPGGRTAVGLSAGLVRYPWRRYILFDALASCGWAMYAALLGYFGGSAFEDAPWKGLLLALAIAFGVAGGVELVRYLRGRRASTGEAGADDDEPGTDAPS